MSEAEKFGWREGTHRSWDQADTSAMHRLPIKTDNAAWHGLPIVGEAHDGRQEVLEELVGGKTPECCSIRVLAELRPEASNPYDRNAVAVFVEGRQVGYLSRGDAARMADSVQRLAGDGRPVTCAALVRGGWRRLNGDEGSFGVTLLIDVDAFLADPHGVHDQLTR